MKVLIEKEAEFLLEKEGLPVAKRFFSNNIIKIKENAKKIKYPVALKVVGKNILHKSDVNGVKLDIRNEQELEKAFNEIKKIKGYEECMVQEYNKGKFLLIGINKDPTFGHILLIGAGDIYTEILKDISMRILPIEENEIDFMLKELKIYQILRGFRNEPSVNFKEIKKIIYKISKLPEKYPKIKELDVNPLIVNEKISKIADARIVFE